jgi:hypothetical protein
MCSAVDERSPSNNQSPLARWIYKTVGCWGVQVKFRVRGNNLHILCEGASCPERKAALLRLVPALQKTDLNTLVPPHQPRLYQVLLYGRKPGQTHPDWTAQIHLNQLDRHLAQLQTPQSKPSEFALSATPIPSGRRSPHTTPPGHTAIVLSNRSLAKRGQTDAIARYLSETLSKLGVAVRVSVKTIPYLADSITLPSQTPADPAQTATTRRLWIICEATYSPDPSLVSEPLAQQLRDLELEGYRDAITLIQVTGENKPDWVLRVDLTPMKEMLREWARWGDVEAIQRLLEQALTNANLHLSTISLKDSTLHLGCVHAESSDAASDTAPDQQLVRSIVAPLLESLGPQGICAATIYGQAAGQLSPAWVEWLDLPAAQHPALADSATTLAKQRDWGAIAFLLNRLLNPDIDRQLAIGGIRLQILPKQDLLHIMTDAPICPDQRRVGPAIAEFLKSLEIPEITGVRVYGRRAGQKRPLWSYGADFASRERLVPEAVPEFAATDAYVGDLIAQSEADIVQDDPTATDLQTAWTTFRQNLVHHVQRILVRSHFFTVSADVQDFAVVPPTQIGYQNGKVAVIWGAIGLLLMIQADWILGQILRPKPAPVAASTPAASVSPSPVAEEVSGFDLSLPNLSLNNSTEEGSSAFNSSGFTQSGQDTAPPQSTGTEATPQSTTPQSTATDASRPAATGMTPVSEIPEPTTPIATVSAADSPYPTFNSRQLDEKIALYYEYLEQYGAPDVMVIGSSRALRGVDPAVLKRALSNIGYKDVTVFNFGVNGATAQVVDLILRELLTPEQLPRLIVWADGARAFNSGGVDVTYNGIAASEGYRQIADGTIPLHTVTPGSPGAATTDSPAGAPTGGIGASLTSKYRSMDRWLSSQLGNISTTYEERDRLKTLLQQTVTTLFPAEPQSATDAAAESATLPQEGQGMIDFEGFLPLSLQFNPATYYQQYARVAGEYDGDYKDFQIEGKQAEALRSLLSLTQSRDIPVVFVNLPLTQQYLDAARLRHEQEFRQYMMNVAVQYPGFVFRDLGELWLDQYDYFSDPSHLNRYGAYEISNHIAQDAMIPWSRTTQD